jgi:hypothetical protein
VVEAVVAAAAVLAVAAAAEASPALLIQERVRGRRPGPDTFRRVLLLPSPGARGRREPRIRPGEAAPTAALTTEMGVTIRMAHLTRTIVATASTMDRATHVRTITTVRTTGRQRLRLLLVQVW